MSQKILKPDGFAIGASRRAVTAAVLVLIVSVGGAVAVRAQRGGDSLPGLDGGALSQAKLQQKDSIVVFWASWSPKCRDIVERLNGIDAKWRGSAQVVSVNFQEDSAEIRQFLGGKNLRAPVYLDSRGAFSRKHAVTDLPGLVIYKDGKVAYQGKMPSDVDSLIQRVLG